MPNGREGRDTQVEALYGLPQNEFVAARNALAKERKDPALKKLPKPSATAWALNQLARHAPGDVDALLAAGRKVAETQAEAVRGRGSAPFKQAVQAERDAMAPLLARVRTLVSGEGQVLKVADALRAATADPSVHDDLRAGRLTTEPLAGGFTGLEGFEDLGAGPEDAHDEDADDAVTRAAEERARAERERRDRQHQAEHAEREAERLEARAAEAEEQAAKLRAKADEARARADVARRAL